MLTSCTTAESMELIVLVSRLLATGCKHKVKYIFLLCVTFRLTKAVENVACLGTREAVELSWTEVGGLISGGFTEAVKLVCARTGGLVDMSAFFSALA